MVKFAPTNISDIANAQTYVQNTQYMYFSCEYLILLGFIYQNSLIIVGKLADAGYYTIFMPGGEGVQVFDTNKSKVVWQEKEWSKGGETNMDCGESQ